LNTFFLIPNIALNQLFENPINPKQLADKTVKTVVINEKSIKLLNKQNSTENFSVPGNPAKNIPIKNIVIARLGR